ncbi:MULTISPECIES: hypothetical protein [Thermomonosporaceae]|uniref:hypothetical protein n=1 Tax=Thermomonosporaceae TaxID=2012 RepID=UPI00255B0FBC|nr:MULTISPECIES: hypothetical protein [Thermomonosporaceae]MDL4777148.1 hypothetical protein [Actinomadura xylanilytica]
MTRLTDRLLGRLARTTTVDAGCSNVYYCEKGIKYLRACCLDQGCQIVKVGKC